MSYLISARKQFAYYRQLGDMTFMQLSEPDFHFQHHEASNSIAIIVKHMHGNMLSRWTNFLTEDGEKTWRKREAEFDNDLPDKAAIIKAWNEGWDCLYAALDPLGEEDMQRIIYIRNQGHTIMEAINRQLCHYSYHVGQIVFLGRILVGEQWHSLSIPRGQSKQFNAAKFSAEKKRGHFTDDFLKEDKTTKEV